jgi:cytochrome bd-type quinol oxidase subunit 2
MSSSPFFSLSLSFIPYILSTDQSSAAETMLTSLLHYYKLWFYLVLFGFIWFYLVLFGLFNQ